MAGESVAAGVGLSGSSRTIIDPDLDPMAVRLSNLWRADRRPSILSRADLVQLIAETSEAVTRC